MYNWLGQEIKVGSVVGRGARDGNGSTFKIGVAIKLDEDKEKVQVDWKYESRRVVNSVKRDVGGYVSFDHEYLGFAPDPGWVGGSKSWCTPESLFVLSDDILAKADKLSELHKEQRERNKDYQDTSTVLSKQEWLDRIAAM